MTGGKEVLTEAKKGEYIGGLTKLATKLQGARDDCMELVNQAMKVREEGKPEVCRGLCYQIIRNEHTDARSKIYAWNILSTQSSEDEALRCLDESKKLTKAHAEDDPTIQDLLGYTATLREKTLAARAGNKVSASTSLQQRSKEDVEARKSNADVKMALEGMTRFGRIPLEERGKGMDVEHLPELTRQGVSKYKQPEAVSTMRPPYMTVEMPKPAMSNTLQTPRTEKIFQWAAENAVSEEVESPGTQSQADGYFGIALRSHAYVPGSPGAVRSPGAMTPRSESERIARDEMIKRDWDEARKNRIAKKKIVAPWAITDVN